LINQDKEILVPFILITQILMRNLILAIEKMLEMLRSIRLTNKDKKNKISLF